MKTVRHTPAAVPRVSVVMASYDAAATIEASIASVQAQAMADWELIVVDDGSRDGSPALVERLAANDPRVRRVRQANAGPSAARNRGVSVARAGIVAFLDSDDLWRTDHLGRALDLLAREPRAGIAFAPCRFLTAAGRETGRRTRAWTGAVTPADILGCNPTATCSSLVVRRQVFETAGLMREDMIHAEDQEWLFRVAAAGWRIVSHPAPTVGYRLSPEGLSADVARMHAGWRAMVAHARSRAPELVAHHLPRAAAEMHLYYAQRLIRDGRAGSEARSHMVQAFAASPLTLARRSGRSLALAALLLLASLSSLLPDRLAPSRKRSRHA